MMSVNLGKKEEFIASTVNGKTSRRYNDITRISISSDGKSWAYGAWDEKGYHIITHESSYGPFDPNGAPPMMSPDGKHFAFFGSTRNGQTGTARSQRHWTRCAFNHPDSRSQVPDVQALKKHCD